MKPFGWCFVGSGSIAHRVAADFPYMKEAQIVSVWSRTGANASAFAEKVGAQAYKTLEEAICAPGVDAVYIATTNEMHYAQAIEAMRLGKPVLCEKPFALNWAQSTSMVDVAKETNVYLMEGMWSRFNPAVMQALRWLREGKIGTPRLLKADFASQCIEGECPGRLYAAESGGGGLLDIGVYTLALSQFVFDQYPARIAASGVLATSGVDEQCAVVLQYDGGGLAQLYSGLRVGTGNDAILYGDHGTILIPSFAMANRAILKTANGEEVFDAHKQGEGFQYEFDAVREDILAGRKENAFITHQYSLAVMQIMDEIRTQIGLRYPQEG